MWAEVRHWGFEESLIENTLSEAVCWSSCTPLSETLCKRAQRYCIFITSSLRLCNFRESLPAHVYHFSEWRRRYFLCQLCCGLPAVYIISEWPCARVWWSVSHYGRILLRRSGSMLAFELMLIYIDLSACVCICLCTHLLGRVFEIIEQSVRRVLFEYEAQLASNNSCCTARRSVAFIPLSSKYSIRLELSTCHPRHCSHNQEIIAKDSYLLQCSWYFSGHFSLGKYFAVDRAARSITGRVRIIFYKRFFMNGHSCSNFVISTNL